jgi:hypothetical protein
MPKPPLPKIYCDVHIKPGAIEGFTKQGLKCIRIPNSEYREQDEKEFIRDLYAKNALFATGDLAFTQYVLDNNVKHAGVIEIPPEYDNEEAAGFAELLAKIIKVFIEDDGKHAWRRRIIYIAHDGIRIIDNTGGDELFYSWEAIERDAGTPE